MVKLVTVKEIARITGIHPNTVRNWCDKGLLEHNRTHKGRRWFPDKDKTVRKVKKLLGAI